MLADLAREVRYRYFDEPVIAAGREATYAEMANHLEALASAPEAPERADRIRALVECPQPLAPLLSSRMRAADPALRRALLETMARRYHRSRGLSPFREATAGGVSFLCSDLEREGETRRLATAFVELEHAADAGRALAALAGDADETVELVADFYAAHPGARPAARRASRPSEARRSRRPRCRLGSNAWCSRWPSRRAGGACPPWTSPPSAARAEAASTRTTRCAASIR